MINTVIFDAFGTLFKVEKGASAKKIICNIISAGTAVNYDSFLSEWVSYYKEHTAPDAPFMTERDIFISRIQMFYERYGVDRNASSDTDAMLSDAFNRRAFDEVQETIALLRKKFRVFIGSNTDNDLLEAVMAKNNIAVDMVYTSEGLKCYKPDPSFFRQILTENDLTPDNVIFIGDSVSDDILGPKPLGIKTVLIDRENNHPDAGQDHTISDLRELTEILTIERPDLA